jgi:predicted site-specific integrase-resolvase
MTSKRYDPIRAAEYLKLSEKTLANWRSQGGGPAFIKAGSRVQYEEVELDRWLASRRRTSTADHAARRLPG